MTAPLVLAAIGLAARRSARGAAAAVEAASDQRSTDQRRLTTEQQRRAWASRWRSWSAACSASPSGVAVARRGGPPDPAARARRPPAGAGRHRAAELPLTLDLLGVCLRAGMPLVAALETVADALPGPFSDDLRVVAGLQRLGAAPADRLGRTRLRSGPCAGQSRRWPGRRRVAAGWPRHSTASPPIVGPRLPRPDSPGPGVRAWSRWRRSGCASCRRSSASASCRSCCRSSGRCCRHDREDETAPAWGDGGGRRSPAPGG